MAKARNWSRVPKTLYTDYTPRRGESARDTRIRERLLGATIVAAATRRILPPGAALQRLLARR